MNHFLAARVAAQGVTVNTLAPAVADLALAILGNGYLTNQVLSLEGAAYPR